MTDAYNPESKEHNEAKQLIEVGNGLPGIRTTSQIDQAVKDAGLELVETADLVTSAEVDWYNPIDPDTFRLEMIQTTRYGKPNTPISALVSKNKVLEYFLDTWSTKDPEDPEKIFQDNGNI